VVEIKRRRSAGECHLLTRGNYTTWRKKMGQDREGGGKRRLA